LVTGSKPNSDSFKNVRHATTRYLRNEKSEYSKVKIKALKTEGKNRNIGGLYKNEFKNRWKPTSNLVKFTTGNVNVDVLNKWKNNICQLLNIHGVNEVRHNEIHTAEPPMPESSSFALDMVADKPER
jgi:hypothetical protein